MSVVVTGNGEVIREGGEMVPLDEYLDECSQRVRDAQQRGKATVREAIDINMEMGHALSDARTALRSDHAFGAWLRERHGFSSQWARVLRLAAENETAVRALLESALSTTGTCSIEAAVREVCPPDPKPITHVSTIKVAKKVYEQLAAVSEARDIVLEPDDLTAIERVRSLCAQIADGKRKPA